MERLTGGVSRWGVGRDRGCAYRRCGNPFRNYLRRSRHLESEGRVPCSALLLSSSPNTKPLDQPFVDPVVNYTIAPRDILSFAWQISKGMSYLADIKVGLARCVFQFWVVSFFFDAIAVFGLSYLLS